MLTLFPCISQVKSISGQVRGGQGKKRKLVLKFAHKLLRMKRDAMPQTLKVIVSALNVCIVID